MAMQPIGSPHVTNFQTILTPETLSQRLSSLEEDFAKSRTPLETEQMVDRLSSLYSELLKQNLNVDIRNNAVSRLCYLYGRTCYGKSMEDSRQLLQLSVILQLNPLKNPIPTASDLKSLPAELSRQFPDFQTTVDLLKDFDPLKLKDKEKFNLASTLRWLGHSYQNLSLHNTKEHLEKFERIYGLVKQILEPIHTADSEWEICELLYNTDRFLISLRYALSGQPKVAEIQEKLDCLNKLNTYIVKEHGSQRSQQKLAQIANIMMMGMEQLITDENRREIRQKQGELISDALKEIEDNPQSDPFFKTMFKNNKASLSLKALKEGVELEKMEVIQSLMDKVLGEIQACDYNHIYHAGYILNAAKLASFRQDKPKALDLLVLAEKVAQKHSDSCREDIEAIAKLRAELTS